MGLASPAAAQALRSESSAAVPLVAAGALSDEYLQTLLAAARSEDLAADRAWTSLLFYHPRALSSERSLIASPGFFLSPQGAEDATAELAASLAAFFAPVSAYKDLNQHPQCAYPARYHWLKERLHFDPNRLPEVVCKDLLGFEEKLAVERVLLVFSSFYLNNPSSMYGHTFLRLHRKAEGGAQRSPMMDYAINFAAGVDNPNELGLVYAFRGLFGGYPGRYDVTRYYMKVQTYNNNESRDLWEYELTLNAAEQTRLLESLWEFGPYHTNYFYFDLNCSYAILALLQAAKPDLNLLESYPHAWVIPSDTVRVVRDHGGFSGKVDYRPSSFSRYLARLQALRGGDAGTLSRLADVSSLAEGRSLLAGDSPQRQAQLLDAVLEFFDYDEKLAGTKMATEHATARSVLLQLRADARVTTPAVQPPAEIGRPDLGHGSTRQSLEQGSSKEFGPYTEFGWRPALHELADSDLGYTPNLQLRFFDTVVRYEEPKKALYLKSWELIEILSLAPLEPLLLPPSWRLAFGLEEVDECTAVPRCYRVRLQGGPGLSVANDSLQAYVMPELDVGYSNAATLGAHVGPALQAGFVWHVASPLKLILTGRERLSYGRSLNKAREADGILAYTFNARFDLRLKAYKSDLRSEVGLNLGYFW